MGILLDSNVYGPKLKKVDERVLHTANQDGEIGEDGAKALPEDVGSGPEDDATALPEDSGSGPEDSGSDAEDDGNGDGGSDAEDGSSALDDSGPFGGRAVQVLAICANFPIYEIIGSDWQQARYIYERREGEVQEEGMVDLVPTGPHRIFMACGYFRVKVYTDHGSGPPVITEAWDVQEDDRIKEYTRTIRAGPGSKLKITYLVIPKAIEANVEVNLKLKGLGSRSRAIYGKIKASVPHYRNKSIPLFSCERGTSLSFPSGSTSILPLSLSRIAVPSLWQLQLHIQVDLTVITYDSQEEQDKNLKFSLEFTREIVSQEREVDDDQIEVKIVWDQIY
ncbi:uncharacterized protein LOC124682308 [Lolium rigidum]|uniref:uncharacterized protein LOC124682308 n=1 Tax=Lolium rigidum TaxID=89674 RepID=UPI001F5C708D|nr:uncharacterized protein LOC124682308 [Lolium rigidum]